MHRMSNVLIAACLAACVVFAGCAEEESPTEEVQAALPDPSTDDEHSEALDVEVPDDPSVFDDDEAVPTDDIPVEDAEDVADLGDSDIAELLADTTIKAALLRWGLHPRASDALRSIGVSASRITQTIGSASASAGTHKQDGTVGGHPYTAATDFSVRGLSTAQIKNLLEKMGKVGFAAWYRQPGRDGVPSSWAPHIHAVYANAKMKSALRSQVRSWLNGRNGLASNTTYRFYTWSSTAKTTVRNKFNASAGGTTNGGSTCVVGGTYCGGNKVSGDRNTLYRCTGAGAPAVVRHCAAGCVIMPAGQDDRCR
jgi:hypothetical protein